MKIIIGIEILLMLVLAHLMINTEEKTNLYHIDTSGILMLENIERNVITLKADQPPNLIVKEVTISKNMPYEITDFIESCNTYHNTKCLLEYQNKQMGNWKEVGTYEITIVAKDTFNKETIQTTRLIIQEPNDDNKKHVIQINLDNNLILKKIEENSVKPKGTFLDENINYQIEKEKINSVLEYVNRYRKEVGSNALQLSEELTIAATTRALEMAQSGIFEHTRPDGRECFSIFDDMHIKATVMGENIAYGYQTVRAVSEAWKKSSTHYDNIINPKYTHIGIGIVHDNNNDYWVQLFANIE